MSDSIPSLQETRSARRPRRGLWLIIGGAALVIVIAVAAALVIPRMLHAERVAAYTELVSSTNAEITRANELRDATNQLTVLYALQLPETRNLQLQAQELAELSDHYFTDADRESLAASAASLSEILADTLLTDDENITVDAAKQTISSDGYVWQTDFLNLAADATGELIEQSASALLVPVADEDVTQTLVDELEAQHAAEQSLRVEAEQAHAAAEARAAGLSEAVAAALVPLASAAETTPAQVEVVIDMYPDAAAESIDQLRESSRLAVGSIDAELFTYEDDMIVPVAGEVSEDTVTFSATDAWRAVIIASHLKSFESAVTGAWISDAGSVEEALGFNPFLPFF